MDRLKEECGIFGIFENKDAAALTALGLHSLQHRGQEGCGIVTFDEKNFYSERRLGLVGDNFTKDKVLDRLHGKYAIGHNRYSTSGNNLIKNVQPFFADLYSGGIAIAHNGNLTNALHLRKELVKNGSIVRAVVTKNTKDKPRSFFDGIDKWSKDQGSSGLAYFTLEKEDKISAKGPIGKFFSESALLEIMKQIASQKANIIIL